MLLNFIATNEEQALWISFSDGNGTGAGALFLKKIDEEAASSGHCFILGELHQKVP